MSKTVKLIEDSAPNHPSIYILHPYFEENYEINDGSKTPCFLEFMNLMKCIHTHKINAKTNCFDKYKLLKECIKNHLI